jgi:hypothetical protein
LGRRFGPVGLESEAEAAPRPAVVLRPAGASNRRRRAALGAVAERTAWRQFREAASGDHRLVVGCGPLACARMAVPHPSSFGPETAGNGPKRVKMPSQLLASQGILG